MREVGVRGAVGYSVRACFRQENEEAKNKLSHPIRPLVQEGLFLVIAAKKKDYHWRIFLFSLLPKKENGKILKPKKTECTCNEDDFKLYIHNA